jgi:response regulator RpfG family c-di-GMP phosphodiesterase
MDFNITQDIFSAFSLPESATLSYNPSIYQKQEKIIQGVTLAVNQDPLVISLLKQMKERIGSHYDHTIRTGIMHIDLISFEQPTWKDIPPKTINLVGILHDCGKLEVPEEILFKEKELTIWEKRVMEAHNRATYNILRSFEDNYPAIAQIAAFHHPYFQPQEVSENPSIRRAGELLRLADHYDALSSRRDYKSPFSPQLIQEILLDLFPKEGPRINHLLQHYPSKEFSII